MTPGQRLDRDFVLRLEYGEPVHASHGLVLASDAEGPEGTFQLTVLPPTGSAVPRPRDVVLVLDRSGSMAGWKMVAARRAAARIVDTLTSADRFAVLDLRLVVERPGDLPAGLVPATDRHRFRAVEHLARAEARGGTEMLRPLREALDLLTDSGGPGPGPGAGHRRAGGQRGPDPAGDRRHDRTAYGCTRSASTRRSTPVSSAGSPRRRRPVRTGRVRGPAGRGDGPDPSPDRCPVGDRPERGGRRHRTAGRHGRRRAGCRTSSRVRPSCSPAGSAAAPAGALVVRGRDREGEPWQARVEGTAVDGAAVRPTWARAHLRDLEDRYATRDRAGPGRPGAADRGDLAAVRGALPVHRLRRGGQPGGHRRQRTAPGHPAGRARGRVGHAAAAAGRGGAGRGDDHGGPGRGDRPWRP